MYLGCFSGSLGPSAWKEHGRCCWNLLVMCAVFVDPPPHFPEPLPLWHNCCPLSFTRTYSSGLAPASLGYITGAKLLWTIWGLVCTVESAACFRLETRIQANGCWNVASSAAFVKWLWMRFLLQRGIEGSNLGSRLIIHLRVSERVQIIGLKLSADLWLSLLWVVCGL